MAGAQYMRREKRLENLAGFGAGRTVNQGNKSAVYLTTVGTKTDFVFKK